MVHHAVLTHLGSCWPEWFLIHPVCFISLNFCIIGFAWGPILFTPILISKLTLDSSLQVIAYVFLPPENLP